MPLNTILDHIYNAFIEQSQDARVILLHPESRYRAALVSRLMASIPVFYYAVGSDDADISSFIASFTHDVAEQVPTFGAAINAVGTDNLLDLVPLLEAFAVDLDQLSAEPYLLLLDEFDRAHIGDDLQGFLETLVDYMPPQCKIVVSSRTLPRFAWLSLIAQHKAVMLRDSELVATDFYENEAKTDARVVVTGLGPGTVVVDGTLVDNWEGHLPRLLFFFALDRPVVTRSEICQAFWPELSVEQAVNVFHVTKRRLHKALESLGVDVLIHEDGSYHVNPELHLHYDVNDFVGALVAARTVDAKHRTQAWQHVIDLYHRPFLQGHSEPWILRRRVDYQAGFLEALSEMAMLRLDDNRPEQALVLLQQAVKENVRRQDLHRRLMSLYADLGRRSEAASHFNKIQEQLSDLGIDLEPETRALHKELISQ